MKKYIIFLLEVAAAFVIVDGVSLAGYYFWDSRRGVRAAEQDVSIGLSHAQVISELGEPTSYVRLEGATIDGVPERWLYGPKIHWDRFKDLPEIVEAMRSGDPLTVILLMMARGVHPDPRDFVVDFNKDGKVVRIIKPR